MCSSDLIAPAKVHIVATGKDDAIFNFAEQLGNDLEAAGITVMLDDRRDPSAGVKFKDAELIGNPYIVVVGKAFADGKVELRIRKTGEKSEMAATQALAKIKSYF